MQESYRLLGGSCELMLAKPDKLSDGFVESVSNGVGEVLLRGTVVGRYVKEEMNLNAFIEGEKFQSWFRTRDLMKWTGEGRLAYCGRSDDFAKVGGKWVDLGSIVASMKEHCWDCCVVWDPVKLVRHFCVVMESPKDVKDAVCEMEEVTRKLRALDPSCAAVKNTSEEKSGDILPATSPIGAFTSPAVKRRRKSGDGNEEIGAELGSTALFVSDNVTTFTRGVDPLLNLLSERRTLRLEKLHAIQRLYPKQDAEIHFLSSLPLNSVTGKTDRKRLLELLSPERMNCLPHPSINLCPSSFAFKRILDFSRLCC